MNTQQGIAGQIAPAAIRADDVGTGRGLDTVINDRARILAAAWFKAQSRNSCAAFYCFYQPSAAGAGTWGRVDLFNVGGFSSPPAPWTAADAGRISPSWTEQKARGFIRQIMRSLPICPR